MPELFAEYPIVCSVACTDAKLPRALVAIAWAPSTLVAQIRSLATRGRFVVGGHHLHLCPCLLECEFGG